MILILFAFMHIIIGIYDFSFYRIPNVFLAFLLGLYSLYAFFYLDYKNFLDALILFAIIFSISFVLYHLKILSSGDAKYIAIVFLWFGMQKSIYLLLSILLAGGVQAIIYLNFKDSIAQVSDLMWLKFQKLEAHYPIFQFIWWGSGTGPEKGQRAQISSAMIPYGVAIATGSLITLWDQSFSY